ncbi:MAG: hypothetical protein KF809_13175 [Chloroflexi bacterium]|nr:hypothetical protein [Chloroflexota bacterium]
MAHDLAGLLRVAREQAPDGDVMLRVHLFGIEHADALEQVDLKQLARSAGVPESFATEIRKGMRLAAYVTLRR